MLEWGDSKSTCFCIFPILWPSSSPFSDIVKGEMTEDVQDLLKEQRILVSFDDRYVLDEELNAIDAFMDQTPWNM